MMLKDKIIWIIVTILLMAGVCVVDHFIIEDELLLYAMMFLTFILILVLKMKARRIWNFVVYAGYNVPLLYCLYYKGDYGTSLYWWTFLLLFNVVHLLVLILFSVISQLKNR